MISDNLQQVRARIATACNEAGRSPATVRLLAVSKTFGADAVLQAVEAGQTAFGENYVQEGVEKIHVIRAWEVAGGAGPLSPPTEWHCIGPIQSNKTRLVAENFDWVHSVERLKIAQRLSEQRPAHLPPLQVCIQVNIDDGPNKAGVSGEQALALAQAVVALPRLQLRGIMCIPEPATDYIAACVIFTGARTLLDHLNAAKLPFLPPRQALGLDTLSMGMSADLAAAIHSGSTLVRVGTAIFGGR